MRRFIDSPSLCNFIFDVGVIVDQRDQRSVNLERD